MRNALLVLAGLVLGTLGALAYSHYLGDGKLLADLQAQLDAANAKLAKDAQDKQQAVKETLSVADQIDHLTATNADLKHQLDDVKNGAVPTAAAPPLNPVTLAGMVMGMFRGGGFQGQQRMFLLQSRLHLTPEQAAAIKAAMDADDKQRRQVARQLFAGGRTDAQTPAQAPAPANVNTLDQVLATTLTPDQQAAYQQVQADEKASRANTSATVQVDQLAPLLQLTDSQREQAVNALYQVQLATPAPESLMTNPNAATIMSSQVQATQDALAKILTPDQMALYQQEGQQVQPFSRRFGGQNGTAAPAASGATATH